MFALALSVLLHCLAAHGADVLRAERSTLPGARVLADYGLAVVAAREPLMCVREGVLYAAAPPGAGRLAAVAPVLVREIRLYPASVLRGAGICRVVLVDQLLASPGLRILPLGGFASHRDRAVVLSVTCANGRQDLSFCLGLHHEAYHFLDRQMGHAGNDLEWRGLGGGGYRWDRRLGAATPTSGEGFVSRYAQSSPGEDKAELFSHLVCYPQEVARLAREDSVLRRKIECLRRRLRSLCPEFDESFWAGLPGLARHAPASIPAFMPPPRSRGLSSGRASATAALEPPSGLAPRTQGTAAPVDLPEGFKAALLVALVVAPFLVIALWQRIRLERPARAL